MYRKTSPSSAPNGVPTPTATPPPASENKKFTPAAVIKTPAFKADVPEGDSPKSLATEPAVAPPKEEQLPEPANPVKTQEEDVKGESDDREHDIYAEAALQCKFSYPDIPLNNTNDLPGSIENREECMMCSG